MQARQLDIPFIIVSGTIGEERAVEVMQRGATDYIIKDRLGRLGPAVQQALERSRLKEEKVKAEQTITRLAAIVETSGDPIITKTLDGAITSWNRAAENLYGYTAEEIIGKNIAILFPQGRRQTDAPEDPQEILDKMSRGEQITAFETVRVRKDKRRIEVLLSISPIRDSAGVVTGASAIALDITQRKRSERFLRAEEAVKVILAECKNLDEAGPRVLQTIAECLRWEVAVLWMIDRRANVMRSAYAWHAPWAKETFVEVLTQRSILERGRGVAGRAWSTGEPVWEPGILMDGQRPETAAVTSEGLRGGFGLPMHHGAKMVGVIEFYNPEMREPDRPLIAALDSIASQISQFCERRRTEALLLASEEQFRQFADAMPHIVWTARPDGSIDYFNDRWYRFAGFSRAEGSAQGWLALVHPDDLQRSEQKWANSVRTGVLFDVEIRLAEPHTGQHRWFMIRAIAGTDAAGTITGWFGTCTDIDEQQRGVQELRTSEERFRHLVMALPAAVYTTDKTGLITLFNKHAAELWGRSVELGKDRWCGSWKLLRLDGTPLPLEECPMAVTLRDGHGVRGEELIIERPDGSRSYVLKHPEPLRGVGGEVIGAVNMVLDVTEKKQLEGQYRQSQKMEAVGQLAAGVAHDFNNILTIILGYTELRLVKIDAADPNREAFVQIRKAADRAAGLTRQLLAFGRKQILAPVVVDLNALMTDVEKMLMRLIGADIEFVCVLDPALGRLKIDPGQFEQVIMNLVVNARDAMPKGGRLTIETHNVVVSESQVRHHADLPAGSYILMSVSDTGSGMDEATKARIFEPFFTTKEFGKGTGLGLATVFGIVKQSGGFIEVDSTVGSGSTFRTYFPQIQEGARLKDIDLSLVTMLRGGETILLVEDEDGLRDLAQLVLETSGYKVLCARDGIEAMQISHDYTEAIHLLFTDVVMPKMSGRQLTDSLIISRRDMKVLFMSGYTDDTMVRHGIEDEGTNFLAKPFTPVALTQKVREVLDGKNGHAAANGHWSGAGKEKNDPFATLAAGS
jgi:PAS domain S-box-containing protein